MNNQQPQIDMSTTESITNKNGVVFQQGFVLRKVSKFVMGADEDAILPIPVFFDPKTSKILLATLPKELRDEYKEFAIEG